MDDLMLNVGKICLVCSRLSTLSLDNNVITTDSDPFALKKWVKNIIKRSS